MPRYIDADKVVKWSYSEPRYSDSVNDRTDLRDFLLSLPTVSPDEVRGVGMWIPKPDNGDCFYECSQCGFVRDAYALDIGNYCPNCGAKMEVIEDA